jgi:dephospho-CoA kinase
VITRDIDYPLRVGLTGGIASGKSVVAEMFASQGIPIVDTDVIAREVVRPGQPALLAIRKQFGSKVFTDDGALDRSALREQIFSDADLRAELEAILHPVIGEETRRQADAARGPYHLIVVPLLVGSPLLSFLDLILVVDCDEDTQISRLLARDAETRAQAMRILAAQASREERLAIADDVIRNDRSLDDTFFQVQQLHRKYCALTGGGR